MKAIKLGTVGMMMSVILGGAPVKADDTLDGIWRGKLEVQSGIYLTVGYTIRDGELTMDSPNQGMFGKAPTSFEIEGNSLVTTDNELSASFAGEFSGDILAGTFTQGREFPLTLHRLDEEAKKRLEFEGRYAGELVINRNSKLPLQVNVAVLHDDYYATLDSPAQQSFGIPLEEFSIDAAQMSFQSKMIQASYSGTWVGEQYDGEMTQGEARPLSLKRVDGNEPQTSASLPEFGEHGGAIAVLSEDEVNTHYFLDHDARTHYEIGSVTKTMVGYALAKALIEERFSIETEVRELWAEAPAGMSVVSLGTHHSGIPRLPDNLFADAVLHDPYAHYDHDLMNEALRELTLNAPEYEYSNFGFGLLGELLAKQAGRSFAEHMDDVLFQPASMTQTYVAVAGTNAPQSLAQGHDVVGEIADPWYFDALAGAGGVVSTLPDMVNYVNYMRQGWLNDDPVVLQMLEVQTQLGEHGDQALAWLISEDEQGNAYAWHNGQTGGYASYVAFYLDGSRAVVILNNQSSAVDEQGLALLTGRQQIPDAN